QNQKRAINQMCACYQPSLGQLDFQCPGCSNHQHINHSCGHRSCPQCGQHHNQQWLERQRTKLLPVTYYMVTFTLPSALRGLALVHPKVLYPILMKSAVDTLQTFAKNDKRLGGPLGLTAVLHTHTRELAYHPHTHVIVPAGTLNDKGQWQNKNTHYLFNGRALAKVFRAKFLTRLKATGFTIKETLPKQWITQCKKVGAGDPALIYLARYLYRGVVNESNLLHLEGDRLTWQYRDSKTRRMKKKCEPVLTFLKKVLQHVLPKGFRRVRDYGLLNGAAKLTLKKVQLLLRVVIEPPKAVGKPEVVCACCGEVMHFCGFIKPTPLLRTY
ncbi:transposase, partial [bacterium AH-315-K03]|nr:transposase [bacterium AH-315-K03]